MKRYVLLGGVVLAGTTLIAPISFHSPSIITAAPVARPFSRAGVIAARRKHKTRRAHPRSQRLAQVRYIFHGLSVQPPHRHRRRATVKMPLYDRYFLQTVRQQRASLRFRDGTVLHLNQHTDAELRSPHVTYVRQGEVDEVLAQGTNHQLQTATAIAAALGTNFDVKVVRKGSYFIVVHGIVRVTNVKGTVVVQPDQETFVARNRAPQPPSPVDAQAATAWTRSMLAPSLVETVTLTARSFEIDFPSRYPGQGRIFFGPGPGCTGLVETATDDRGSGTRRHDVLVTGNDLPGTAGNIGITPGATYLYEVVTIGTSSTEVDNNRGKCYKITVPRA